MSKSLKFYSAPSADIKKISLYNLQFLSSRILSFSRAYNSTKVLVQGRLDKNDTDEKYNEGRKSLPNLTDRTIKIRKNKIGNKTLE